MSTSTIVNCEIKIQRKLSDDFISNDTCDMVAIFNEPFLSICIGILEKIIFFL